MSFDEKERSNYDAIPVTLYEFTLGPNEWLYASSESDVPFGDKVYKAIPIDNSGMVQSGDVQNDDFTVTLPASEPVVLLFLSTPPSDPIYLAVRKKNRGEDEAPVTGVYTVSSARRTNQIAAEIVCKTLSASLNRNGLRLAYGRGCPHALYDRNCRVDPVKFAITVQVEALTGATVKSDGLENLNAGYLAGGYFEFILIPGVMERRAIESHNGDTFTVLGTTDGLKINDWVTVYPGCDRVTSTCALKFNNLANYGGFPHLPTKSPFDGDPVF